MELIIPKYPTRLLALPSNFTIAPSNLLKRFFVTFIDDHSRYGYVYLINHKSEAFDKFKIFKTEVERKLGKLTKVVKSALM